MRKLAVIAVLFAVLLVECGVRGNPTPPIRKELPPGRIDVYQEGKNIKVKVRLPDNFKDGEKIEYKRVKIYLAWEGGEKKIWEGERPLKVIKVGVWPEILGKEVNVKAEIRGRHIRKTKLSSKTITVKVTPLPPRNLKAEARNEGVYLSWMPPQKNWDGSEARPVGYIVFRNRRIITSQPVITSYFLDASVKNGKEYSYSVAALVSLKKPYSIGELSPSVKIRYADVFPPEPPGKVEVIVSGKNVLISWKKSESADVIGYNIWRDEKKLNKSPVEGRNFWDRDVPAGRHSYWVTAVDDAGNNSAKSEIRKVEVK